jgi:polyisoprenoid-binding protein YceI
MNNSIPFGTWTVDASHSTVTFTVRHLMISKVRGSFGAFTGTLVTSEDITDSKLNASINTTSITTNDENRDNHLRSADFFDVDNFPEITFVSREITATKDGDVFTITGDLTIKDVTRPVTFTAEIGGVQVDGYGQTKIAAELTTTINRTDFGLTWNTALETGGVLVSEEVTINVDTQAVLNN